MVHASDSFGRRVSNSGLGLGKPSLLIVGGVFAVWFLIELLLAGRFWIQLTGADKTSTLNDAVLSLSAPLVSPFSNLQPSAADQATGTFEYGTVVAAEVYLVLAIVAIVALVLIKNIVALSSVFAPRVDRSASHAAIELAETSPLSTRSARLCNTFFLPLAPEEALEALRNLTLERFDLEFVTIPAQGGSVVAVFAPVDEEFPAVPIISRFRQTRQEHLASRMLESIGATVSMPATAATTR